MLGLIVIVSFFLVIYHLVVYQSVVAVMGLLSPAVEAPVPDAEDLPAVALLIAARNEEASIAARLENALQLDYPQDKLEVVVVANGCTDATADIVRGFSDRGVRLLEYDDVGKSVAQNRAVETLESEIVVFTDANTAFSADALLHLVAPFSDPGVGSVGGRHVYTNTGDATGAAEGIYWNVIERALKQGEARLGTALGANGSIYAIRRDLYVPVKADVPSDFIAPLLVAANGYRTEYAPRALSMERAEASFAAEYARKRRIVRRSVHALLSYPELVDPRTNPRLAWMLISHKVLRWWTPALLLVGLGGALLRMAGGRATRIEVGSVVLASLMGFLMTLGRGLGRDDHVPVITHAYYLYLMFRAAIEGTMDALTRGGVATWEHNR